MAFTAQQKLDAARSLAKEIFVLPVVTAHSDLDELVDAIGSVDVAMGTVINAVPIPWETKTLKEALIDNLPNPFKDNSTATEKAMTLALWSMKEAGLI